MRWFTRSTPCESNEITAARKAVEEASNNLLLMLGAPKGTESCEAHRKSPRACEPHEGHLDCDERLKEYDATFFTLDDSLNTAQRHLNALLQAAEEHNLQNA